MEARDALIQRVDRDFGLEIGNGRIADNGVPVAELIVGARRSGASPTTRVFSTSDSLAVADGQGDDILASCADVELRCRSGVAAQECACASPARPLKGPQIGQAVAGIARRRQRPSGHDGP